MEQRLVNDIRPYRCAKPILLCGGRGLSAWIKSGGRPTRPIRMSRLRLSWSEIWFERCAEISAKRCSTISLPRDPTFILGLWRTGSTLLHNMLADTNQWTTPRTWQCFRPANFLLYPPPAKRELKRPMDAGIVGTFSPQEDEFASLLLGERSLYRAFIDPRRIDEVASHLESWRQAPTVGFRLLSERWETFIKGVVAQAPGPLLLKSPNHTFRLPWLASRFPDAQFIWLTRPAPEVFASNQRMWSDMIDRYALWNHVPSVLDAFLRRAIGNHDELLDWARATIGDRLHIVSFSDVMHRGTDVVSGLVAKLGVRRGQQSS
jgi:hypothetical protein